MRRDQRGEVQDVHVVLSSDVYYKAKGLAVRDRRPLWQLIEEALVGYLAGRDGGPHDDRPLSSCVCCKPTDLRGVDDGN